MSRSTELPPGYALRIARAADAPAIQALLNAAESADCGEDRQVDFEIAGDLLDPDVDVTRDWILIADDSGRPAAFGQVYCDVGGEPPTYATVAPAHRGRGLAACLLELAEQSVRQRLADRSADPGWHSLRTECADTKTERIAWLRGRGYRRVRDSYAMRIDLSRGYSHPVWPAGLDVRDVCLPDDLRPIYDADTEAFREHFGYHVISFESWSAWFDSQPESTPELWLVAWDGAEVAGDVVGAVRGEAGYVGSVAVRKPYRRRGLALALLLELFARLHARGRDDVFLFVDAENPTGAVPLYERAGMSVWRRFGAWRLELSDRS
ncbi:MAG TPA: GNAT family N-acetyltransferase [Thermoleophilia bacterium]|nr:GNAT family N-acetyltransferase [Thermoleophilia bacterium]